MVTDHLGSGQYVKRVETYAALAILTTSNETWRLWKQLSKF